MESCRASNTGVCDVVDFYLFYFIKYYFKRLIRFSDIVGRILFLTHLKEYTRTIYLLFLFHVTLLFRYVYIIAYV